MTREKPGERDERGGCGPDEPGRPRSRSRQVGDRVAEKLEQAAAKQERALARNEQRMAHLERHAERHEQAMAKMAETAERLDRLTAHLEAIELWTRAEPASRKPRFTRDDIARTAIRIADEEGFDALSMRNLAAALGAGTMTIYHYVKTKDELLTLLNDAVMGEIVLPPSVPMPEHWRDALRLIAHRSRDALLRHPWMMDMPDIVQIGPNSVRHFDETLQAVSSLPLPLEEQLELSAAVDEYVFGHCINTRSMLPPTGEETDSGMRDYVEQLMATGNYPALAARAEEWGADEMWAMVTTLLADPSRFDRGLDLVLDGIEARVNRARPPGPSAKRARGRAG